MPYIERLILDYFVRNPRAADTAEGIAQWWLANVRPPPQLRDVEHALHRMVEKGILIAQEDCAGLIHYKLTTDYSTP